MFTVRSKSGLSFMSCEIGPNNGKEIEYKTKAEAQKELESIQKSFSDQEFYIHEITMGRPTIGITKKISLTLTEDNWEWFEEKAKGNRSGFIRDLVWNALGNESEWSNHACRGYAIAGAKSLNYTDEQITELIGAISSEFDTLSVEESKDIYTNSPY